MNQSDIIWLPFLINRWQPETTSYILFQLFYSHFPLYFYEIPIKLLNFKKFHCFAVFLFDAPESWSKYLTCTSSKYSAPSSKYSTCAVFKTRLSQSRLKERNIFFYTKIRNSDFWVDILAMQGPDSRFVVEANTKCL